MQFAQASDVQQVTKAASNVEVSLRAFTMAAIWTAADAGASTTSAITWTTCSEAEMLKILAELRQQGYGVTLGSGTLTVTW